MSSFEMELDIEGVEILSVDKADNGDIIIHVSSTDKWTKCRRCGRNICKFHGHDREINLRHLSILGMNVYIRIRPARYQCTHCRKRPTTTQIMPWYYQNSPCTKYFENHILLQMISSTVEDVSVKEDLGYEAIMGIINRGVGTRVDWKTITNLDCIGLDEISLKKGHKDFVTIVTGRVGERTMILGVLKDRTKKTVKKFLKGIPKKFRKTVNSICSDMYDGFINAAKEVFGGKVIVIDRFHVAKSYRNGLDSFRKKELKRLKEELSEEEYKKLKGAMWAIRKKKEKLSEENDEVLRCLFNHSPKLKEAYDLSNDLTDIFEEDISKSAARPKIRSWVKRVRKSGLKCFDRFIKTLEKYMDQITNYFINGHTSGFVEGLNNKIKVIKRRCYGILNVKHLFQRIYLDLEGYSLFT